MGMLLPRARGVPPSPLPRVCCNSNELALRPLVAAVTQLLPLFLAKT